MHRWLVLSQTDPRPLYLQIIEQVKRRVAIGELKGGEEIPSIRQLASEIQVSVITVKRAYFELERDGVITTRQGKGSFVADRPKLAESLVEQELNQLIDKVAEIAVNSGVSRAELSRRLAAAMELKPGRQS